MIYRLSVWAVLSCVAAAASERVSIEQRSDGSYAVVSSTKGPLGRSGTIRGAGGDGHIGAASNAGADAMRTWGVDGLEDELKEAEAVGLKVSAGIWMPHEKAMYENCSDMDADPAWQAELARYVKAVRKYKNSSGILWWTVGNEIETETAVTLGSECTWRRLEWAVQAVKREDPDHPVGTVIAGPHVPKIRLIGQFAPSLDFLGINAYGEESLLVGHNCLKANFTKPYAIMEFGPSGHWIAPLTEWGAIIEESSSEKVPRYNATCYSCYDDPRCLGAFAFVWGWKWEKTGTWYGMFNEWPEVTEGVAVDCPACESEVMETMETCWTGKHRSERPPTIRSVSLDGKPLPDMSFVVPQGKNVTLRVDASHPLGRDLVGIWGMTNDVLSDAVGGAFEETKALVKGVWPGGGATGTGLSVVLDTSSLLSSSEHRLYVFVRQDPASCEAECDKQEAVASLPFRICRTAVEGDVCYRHVVLARERGIRLQPERYPGVGASSSFEEVQMLLHQQGAGECPPPCGVRNWCRTSVKGEDCYEQVRWLMRRVSEKPDLYPKALRNATFEKTQLHISETRDGVCPRPCEEDAPTEHDDSLDEVVGEEPGTGPKSPGKGVARDVTVERVSSSASPSVVGGSAALALALATLLL